jgi:hypothetical protein
MKGDAIAAFVFSGLAIAVALVVLLCVYCQRSLSPRLTPLPEVQLLMPTTPLPPAIIWTYWNSPQLPTLVRKSIASWQRHHPQHDVRVVTPDTLGTYMDTALIRVPWNDSPAREADIVRLHILATHGGIWADATVYVHEPFPFVDKAVDFSGYYLGTVRADSGHVFPAMESWCFATAPGGAFVTAWRDAFMHAGGTGTIPQRANAIMNSGIALGRVEDMRDYLFIYVAAQYVFQKVLPVDFQTQHMFLLDAAKGPVKYAVDHDWEPRASVAALIAMPRTGIFKLWNAGRKELETAHSEWIEELE